MKFPFYVCFAFAVLTGTLQAQSASPQPTPLSEPLVQKRAPDFASWLITREPAPGQPKPTPATAAPESFGSKVGIIKTDELLVQSTYDYKGEVWTTWCKGPVEIMIYPDKKNSIYQAGKSGSGATSYTDYTKTDFPDFSWVSQSCYAGTAKFKGQSCLIFFGHRDVESWNIFPVSTAPPVPGAEAKPPFDPKADWSVTAYVDDKTRLPVALQESKNISTYTFLAPPTEKLQLPTMVQEIIDQRAANMRALIRKTPQS